MRQREQQLSQELVGIDTVTSLDLDAFLGRWYQMYGSISSTLLQIRDFVEDMALQNLVQQKAQTRQLVVGKLLRKLQSAQ